jgi:hypothetical protein
MNYAKPAVVVLGEAVRVIKQFTSKNNFFFFDGPRAPRLNPAYDLDE